MARASRLNVVRFLFAVSASLFLIVVSVANANGQTVDDTMAWPTFRGTDGNGVSTTATPPITWNQTRNIAWKKKIPGKGSSSPIIVGNRVFITAATPVDPAAAPKQLGDQELIEKHRFMVLCYDRASGDPIWRKTAVETTPHERHHQDHGYASASPVTDGQRLYINFGSQGLYCYDLEGNLQWKRDDLGKMTTRGSFGEGSSVTVAGDILILPWDHEGQSYIEAMHCETGRRIWKVLRDEPSNWVTPRVVDVDGRKQILQVGQNFTRGYDLETGKEIWRASGLSQRPVACPVVKGNVGFVASARGGAILQAILLDQRGDITSNGFAWTIQKQTPDIPSLLLSENRLYFIGSNRGILTCANADTGKPFYEPQRLSLESVYSSPVAANGNVFVTSRKGKTLVIRDAVNFDIVSTNDLGEPVDATLALVDQEIFIRGRDHLYCIRNK